ncbi:hypothetical protein LEMLEM_LOCUS22491, partial [Lemmus lemmus]
YTYFLCCLLCCVVRLSTATEPSASYLMSHPRYLKDPSNSA